VKTRPEEGRIYSKFLEFKKKGKKIFEPNKEEEEIISVLSKS